MANDPAVRAAVARCIEIAREVRDGFLSPEYATDQPLSSLTERFACDQVAQATARTQPQVVAALREAAAKAREAGL